MLTPAWPYLLLSRASGELWEYMESSRERQAGGEYFTDEEWLQVSLFAIQRSRELEAFASMWDGNLCAQGFLRAFFQESPAAPADNTNRGHVVA